MIDLTNRHIIRRGRATPIKEWKVWWITPFGITPSLEEAIEWVMKRDLDPELIVVPVSVAIDNESNYEIFYPRN